MQLRRVLIIEHESDIGELLKSYLKRLPADVILVADAREALSKALTGAYDLIILDQTLPGMDGLDICRAVRADEIQAAVLMLSSRPSEADRILALELGADDYMCKPFNIGELLARAKALLRRTQGRSGPGWIDAGSMPIQAAGLFIDPATRRVKLAGRDVSLTSKEHDLLYLLASQADRVFTRPHLLSALWKSPYQGHEHAVSCHINRLRLKIEPDAHKPRYIITVWGVGYKFAP